MPREMQAGAPCTPPAIVRQINGPSRDSHQRHRQGQARVTCRARYLLQLQLVFGCQHPAFLIARVSSTRNSCLVLTVSSKSPSILRLITAKHPTLLVIASGAKLTFKPASLFVANFITSARSRARAFAATPYLPKLLSSQFHLISASKSPNQQVTPSSKIARL